MIQRVLYFDLLRGFAIAMVLLIHGYGHCYAYPDVPLWSLGFRNILNVAVPLFLTISGYFLASKGMDNGGYVEFLRRQISRVYIPMLFCSMPMFFAGLSHGEILAPFVSLFSCNYSVYYFIAVIIQCYLLLPILQKTNLKIWLFITAIIGMAWLVFYSYYISMHLGRSLPLILYAGHFAMWGFFFVLGVYFRKFGLPKISFKILIPLLVFALLVAIFESSFIMNGTQSMRGGGQKASVFLLNTLLLVVLFHNRTMFFCEKFKDKRWFRIVVVIGNYSFGIVSFPIIRTVHN